MSWIQATPVPNVMLTPTPVPTPTPYYLAKCYETDLRMDFNRRGTSAGNYNGVYGFWEDSCSWNGTDLVLREYYCLDSERSPIVNFTERLCLTQCFEGACEEACNCGSPDYTVCGMDNRTYRSACLAECAGTTVKSVEPCAENCFQLNSICKTSADCCSGKCAPWSKKCVDCVFDSECGLGKNCAQGRCG